MSIQQADPVVRRIGVLALYGCELLGALALHGRFPHQPAALADLGESQAIPIDKIINLGCGMLEETKGQDDGACGQMAIFLARQAVAAERVLEKVLGEAELFVGEAELISEELQELDAADSHELEVAGEQHLGFHVHDVGSAVGVVAHEHEVV